MVWLIGIGCLALGLVLGATVANRLGGSPARIKELENQVKGLEERHDRYKVDVSEHFNVTADLVQQMTQSYRDVYQHLATGAQDLCSSEVADKLLPVGSDAVFDTATPKEEALGFNPPKDYAAKQNPGQKGALAEDFGLQKTRAEETRPYEPPPEPVTDKTDRNVNEYRPKSDNTPTPDSQTPPAATTGRGASGPTDQAPRRRQKVAEVDGNKPLRQSSRADNDSPATVTDDTDMEISEKNTADGKHEK